MNMQNGGRPNRESDLYVVHPADRPFGGVIVTCRCTRTMDPVYGVSKNNFRCGCGAEVNVTMGPDYRVDPSVCHVMIDGHRCGRSLSYNKAEVPWQHQYSRPGLGMICDECSLSLLHGWAEVPEIREYFIKLTMRGELSYRRREAWRAWYDRDREVEPERSVPAGHVVYYVRLGNDHIKIGTTGNLNRRMRELRVANPKNLLAVERGTAILEKHRHRQFAACKFNGWREDFHEAEPLMEHIELLRKMLPESLDEAA